MKSIFGLSENVVAALSYVLGPISGIFVLVMERENKFVRFHALQSTLWFLFMWIVFWVLGLVVGLPIIGWLIGFVLIPVRFVLRMVFVASKLFLVLRAFLGHKFKLPLVGDVVANQIDK